MNQSLLLEKLEGIKIRFDDIAQKVTDPDIVSDMKKYIKLNKEYKELEPLVNAFHNYKNIIGNINPKIAPAKCASCAMLSLLFLLIKYEYPK